MSNVIILGSAYKPGEFLSSGEPAKRATVEDFLKRPVEVSRRLCDQLERWMGWLDNFTQLDPKQHPTAKVPRVVARAFSREMSHAVLSLTYAQEGAEAMLALAQGGCREDVYLNREGLLASLEHSLDHAYDLVQYVRGLYNEAS